MTLRAIKTTNAPAAVASYSQAIDTGPLVFLAGQIGLDPQSGEIVPGGIEAEAERALRTLLHRRRPADRDGRDRKRDGGGVEKLGVHDGFLERSAK